LIKPLDSLQSTEIERNSFGTAAKEKPIVSSMPNNDNLTLWSTFPVLADAEMQMVAYMAQETTVCDEVGAATRV
jgi:hypothetical protein